MLQPWSNCGYEARARKAVGESFDDDSWATCPLGRVHSPRLPRKGLMLVFQSSMHAADGDWNAGRKGETRSGNGCAQKETVT